MLAPLLVLDGQERWLPLSVDESLERVGYEWADGTFRRDGEAVARLDLPAAMSPGDFDGLAVCGYHRVVGGGGLEWHQFWTWWPYNPKTYAGHGEHEGDWEMVQIGCAGEQPILVTASQHDGGERRHYWDVTLGDGPLVYVARDSHANYFTPVRTVTDVADGGGRTLAPAWLELGPWERWDGQWGNSANSPGPLSTRRAWMAPHAWHSQARG